MIDLLGIVGCCETLAMIMNVARTALPESKAYPLKPMPYRHISELIFRDVQRAVKNTRHVDVPIVLHQVGDPVVPIEQESDVAPRSKVTVSDFGVPGQNLRPP